MKYRIEISGRGGEIVVGTVSQDIYDYFDINGVSIEEYASDWDNDFEVPLESQPFEPGEWHDCDDIAHEFGTDTDNTFITVTDEDNKVLLDNVDYSKLLRLGASSECDDIYPEDILEAGAVLFVGQSYEKGLFYSFEIEADAFDISKLTIFTTDVDGWELVTSIQYNGEDLEDLGEMSTDSKGYDFSMRVAGEY